MLYLIHGSCFIPTQGSIFGEMAFVKWYVNGENATASADVVALDKKVSFSLICHKSIQLVP